MAERSYLTSKVSSSSPEELPHVQGAVAMWAQEGQEELLHVQGKEQHLHFAGVAVNRYPTSKVRETQVRW